MISMLEFHSPTIAGHHHRLQNPKTKRRRQGSAVGMSLSPATSSPTDAAPSQPAADPTPRPGKDSPLHCLQCKMAGLRCSLTSKHNIAPAGGPCSRCLRISEPLCMRQDVVVGDYRTTYYEPLNPRLANSPAFDARLEELLAVERARLERQNWVLPAWDDKAAKRTPAETEGKGAVADDRSMS